MADDKDKPGVFKVACPCCGSALWVDGEGRAVLRSEKAPKKKGSLDEMLVKEKERQDGFGRKFEATFELQKERHAKADELFKQALEKAEQGEGNEGEES